jgi:hypothetical protein
MVDRHLAKVEIQVPENRRGHGPTRQPEPA